MEEARSEELACSCAQEFCGFSLDCTIVGQTNFLGHCPMEAFSVSFVGVEAGVAMEAPQRCQEGATPPRVFPLPHSLAGAVAPRGGGTGPGRVRNGRAGGRWRSSVRVAGRGGCHRPAGRGWHVLAGHGPVPAASGPARSSRLVQACPLVRSFVPYGTRPAAEDSSWGTNRARHPPRRSWRRANRGY